MKLFPALLVAFIAVHTVHGVQPVHSVHNVHNVHSVHGVQLVHTVHDVHNVPAAHSATLDSVHEGDLAFVVNPRGNAITSVTSSQSIDSLPIDHVGILHRIGGDHGPLYVLEAIGRGVVLTPVDSFLVANGGEQNIIVGRVEDLDARRSVRAALRYVGRPYDYNYMPGDSAIYCSELVEATYVDLNGRPVFETIPMNFRTPAGDIHPYWLNHYGRQGLPVPQDTPGTNPAQLSRSPRLTISQFPKTP